MASKALPMAPPAFEQWCHARALASSTCDYLSSIRGSQPVRRVTSRANNVSGTYPSRKMGVTIQFESQNPELWALVMMDRDPEVLEFFEQPDTFKLRYLDKTGKKMQGHYYTPDFLVLRNDSVCFEEWKREDDLKRLAASSPFRYQPQEDGSWRCPPAEEAVSGLGLTFRVRSSAELHSTYVDNLLFLEDYFGMTLAIPVPVQTTILQRLRETPGLPLSALASDGSGVRANDVYAMVALDLIYTDLYAAPLIQHGRVRLYLNAEQARTYAHLLPTRLTSRVGSPLPEVNAPLTVNTTLLWDGRSFTLINPGDTTTTLLPEKGTPIQIPSGFFFQLLDIGVITRLRAEEDPPVSPEVDRLMDQATPDDQRQATARFEKVIAYLNGEKEHYAKVPPRTLHRWVTDHWLYFYECSVGCIGILKDWLLRAVSAALDDGASRLSLDCVQDHALHVDIYRQMALDAYEGEQRLNHTASNREHVWRLLQGGELIAPVPPLPPRETPDTRSEASTVNTTQPLGRTRRVASRRGYAERAL